jgi:hypothetical protein
VLRVAVAVAVVTGALVAMAATAACKSNAHIEAASDLTCIEDTELHTCECNAFGPASDDPSVAQVMGCDAPPAGVVWDCVVQGASPNVIDCTCGVATCFLADGDSCRCEIVTRASDLGGADSTGADEGGATEAGASSIVAQHPIQAQCTAAVGHCCKDPSSCVCSSATCTSGQMEVATCTPPTPTHAPNCTGLVYEGQ